MDEHVEMWLDTTLDNIEMYVRAKDNLRKSLHTVAKFEMYRERGYPSFKRYCTEGLGLTEKEIVLLCGTKYLDEGK